VQTIADPDPNAKAAAIDAIGIVGGGQLALMLAQAARDLGVALHVQTPGADDPATREAASVVLAAVDDVAATRELASRCHVISFENEWIQVNQRCVSRIGISVLDSSRVLLEFNWEESKTSF
jgi:5-(carboxyamino)imidazole ribonucleotide synthase